MSACRYIRIYLAVYGSENKGSFGLEEKNESRLPSRKNKLWRFVECVTLYNRPCKDGWSEIFFTKYENRGLQRPRPLSKSAHENRGLNLLFRVALGVIIFQVGCFFHMVLTEVAGR